MVFKWFAIKTAAKKTHKMVFKWSTLKTATKKTPKMDFKWSTLKKAAKKTHKMDFKWLITVARKGKELKRRLKRSLDGDNPPV